MIIWVYTWIYAWIIVYRSKCISWIIAGTVVALFDSFSLALKWISFVTLSQPLNLCLNWTIVNIKTQAVWIICTIHESLPISSALMYQLTICKAFIDSSLTVFLANFSLCNWPWDTTASCCILLLWTLIRSWNSRVPWPEKMNDINICTILNQRIHIIWTELNAYTCIKFISLCTQSSCNVSSLISFFWSCELFS